MVARCTQPKKEYVINQEVRGHEKLGFFVKTMEHVKKLVLSFTTFFSIDIARFSGYGNTNLAALLFLSASTRRKKVQGFEDSLRPR
jgi:hypothetical protein